MRTSHVLATLDEGLDVPVVLSVSVADYDRDGPLVRVDMAK